MKKLLSIFILTSLTTFVNGQTWAPTGAKWYYSHYSGAQPYLTVIESIGDTIINTKQCKILKTYEIDDAMDSTLAHHWDTIVCPLQYTFQDSGIVYLFDSSKNDFNILYDFNAINGDTVTVNDTTFSGYCPDAVTSNLFQYVVDSVNDIIISGISLHRQFVKRTQNSDWFFSDPSGPTGNYPIIERIGSLKYLFGVTINFVMEGPVCCLRCYEDSDIYYHSSSWPDTIPCSYLPSWIVDDVKENDINTIKVFPNPAHNQIYVENKFNQQLDYYIINSYGQLIKTGVLRSDLTSIILDNFRAGFYDLIIKTDNKIISKHLIIKK
ncbi:MAG: T9SS type A sorting domain-containing protein [Thermoplasmata archaeon]